jgi:hypothetical protein
MVAGSIWLMGVGLVMAQTNKTKQSTSPAVDSALTKMLTENPVPGPRPLLRLNADYVNSPKEDYEMLGVWNSPLTLDQLNGLIAEFTLGDARRRGDWQLAYKRKMMTMDNSWQSIADANPSLTLSQRSAEVLKASYNVRDWWQLGVAAVFEQKLGAEAGFDPAPFGLGGGESLGLQIDSSVKF